jgi:uncharacterized protein YjiS (DUF1127 family)
MADHTFPVLVARAGNGDVQVSLATRLVDKLLEWIERGRTRHVLAGLTDAELKDIGLGRGDVAYETGKPFWRA